MKANLPLQHNNQKIPFQKTRPLRSSAGRWEKGTRRMIWHRLQRRQSGRHTPELWPQWGRTRSSNSTLRWVGSTPTPLLGAPCWRAYPSSVQGVCPSCIIVPSKLRSKPHALWSSLFYSLGTWGPETGAGGGGWLYLQSPNKQLGRKWARRWPSAPTCPLVTVTRSKSFKLSSILFAEIIKQVFVTRFIKTCKQERRR